MKKILLISVLVATVGYAEKVRFEYGNPVKDQSVEITGVSSIDILSGDIKVVPADDVFIVPSQPAVIGINADSYQAEVGDTINVNWEVAFADSCTGTVSQGSVSGWAGTLSHSIGLHSKNVVVNSLPATLRISCSNLDAYTAGQVVIKDLDIELVQEVVQNPPDDPYINYFKANGASNSTSIQSPGAVSITWSVSNADSCTATSSPVNGAWNHTFNPNNSSSKQVNISQTTTLSLLCGNSSRNVQVILNENNDPDPPPGCTTNVYPGPGLAIKNYNYATLKDGNEFGTTTSGNVAITINNTNFASVEFTTPNIQPFSRRINFVTAPLHIGNKADKTSFSISSCPGDYSQNAECVVTVNNNGGNVKITTLSGYDGVAGYCVLDPNTTYYMNFVNKENPYVGSPQCLDPGDAVCTPFFSEGELELVPF